jgi:hypothetical protein
MILTNKHNSLTNVQFPLINIRIAMAKGKSDGERQAKISLFN